MVSEALVDVCAAAGAQQPGYSVGQSQVGVHIRVVADLLREGFGSRTTAPPSYAGDAEKPPPSQRKAHGYLSTGVSGTVNTHVNTNTYM